MMGTWCDGTHPPNLNQLIPLYDDILKLGNAQIQRHTNLYMLSSVSRWIGVYQSFSGLPGDAELTFFNLSWKIGRAHV